MRYASDSRARRVGRLRVGLGGRTTGISHVSHLRPWCDRLGERMRICSRCGTQAGDRVWLCAQCGTPLAGGGASDDPEVERGETSSSLIVVGVLTVVVILVMAGVAVAFLPGTGVNSVAGSGSLANGSASTAHPAVSPANSDTSFQDPATHIADPDALPVVEYDGVEPIMYEFTTPT